MSHLTTFKQTVLGTLAAASLVACGSLAPDYERPVAPVPAQFPPLVQTPPTGVAAPDLPWQSFFADTSLQKLIQIALDNNRDLRVALLNVEQARTQVDSRNADRWHRTGRADRGARVAPLEQDRLPAVEVAGHDAQRQWHLLDASPARLIAHIARQSLATDQPAPRKGPIGQGRLVHRLGQTGQFDTILARSPERRHQAAGGGAHHQIRSNARRLQRLDHADVSESAGGAPTQRQADPRGLGRRGRLDRPS